MSLATRKYIYQPSTPLETRSFNKLLSLREQASTGRGFKQIEALMGGFDVLNHYLGGGTGYICYSVCNGHEDSMQRLAQRVKKHGYVMVDTDEIVFDSARQHFIYLVVDAVIRGERKK